MALGVKTKPNGYFEIGDLLYARRPEDGDPVYYTEPNENGPFYNLSTTEGYIGVIRDNDVKDRTTPEPIEFNTWLEVTLPDGKIGYVGLDSYYVKSVVNPEFDYPDKTTSGTFNWSGLLNGISTLGTSLFSIFNSRQNADGNTTATVSTTTATSTPSFFQKYWILLLIFPLFIVLMVLIFRKPKATVATVPVSPPMPKGKRISKTANI